MDKIKSYLKKLQPVSIYKRKDLSIEDRFIAPEKKGQKWRDKFLAWSQDKNPITSVINFYARGYLFTRIEPWRYELDYMLRNFTLSNVSDEEVDKIIDTCKNLQKRKVKDIKRKGRDSISIKLKNGREINAVAITSWFNDIDQVLPQITTNDRLHKCHTMSRKLAVELLQNNIPSFIATGVVNELSKKDKYLHSWVEMEKDGKDLVLDPTKNIIMRKENYYYLYQAEEVERIEAETLYNDEEMFWDLCSVDPYYSKLYLYSRDEAIETWKKFGFDKMTNEEREIYYKSVLKKLKQQMREENNTSENE